MTTMTHTILIVEDEAPLRDLVYAYLVHAGYTVMTAADGPSGLACARAEQPELIVLDLMLPGFDGLELCRQLRTFSDAYVLMLTARSEELDRVVGLEVGADDYLTKPFSPRELVARVRALLRRARAAAPMRVAPQIRRFGNLLINLDAQRVSLADDLLALTPTEYALLITLTEVPDRVISRAQLLEQVWGTQFADNDHIVDVHIANLRRKLGPSVSRWIETVRGTGYRFAGYRA